MSSSDERVEALATWFHGRNCPWIRDGRNRGCRGPLGVDRENARNFLDSPAMRDLLADAWDRGWNAGWDDETDRFSTNPYRAEADR